MSKTDIFILCFSLCQLRAGFGLEFANGTFKEIADTAQ